MFEVKRAEKFEVWAVDRLVPYEKNSRTHSDEQVDQIATSISEFGFVNPILVDSQSGIIAGHGRLMAARKLGLQSVPVLVVDHLTEKQKRAYIIADNKLALNAGWDTVVLSEELKALAADDFDVALTGFTDDELAELLSEEQEEPEGDEEATPEPPAEPKTKRGDIYQLGRHRLMCGDSTSIDDVEHLMDGQKADMVFTDPPYGVEFKSNWREGRSDTKFDVLKNDDKILDIAPIVFSFSTDNAPVFIWTAHQVYPQWREQFSQFYINTIIWRKGKMGMGDLESYGNDYEIALFCSTGRPTLRGERKPAVWDIQIDNGASYLHPTQKPVGLAEKAINDFDIITVLDLFGGSGSTLIAAEKAGRKACLMELDPKYCDVIVARWEQYTGKKARLLTAEDEA